MPMVEIRPRLHRINPPTHQLMMIRSSKQAAVNHIPMLEIQLPHTDQLLQNEIKI
jgi:hypothetical protein